MSMYHVPSGHSAWELSVHSLETNRNDQWHPHPPPHGIEDREVLLLPRVHGSEGLEVVLNTVRRRRRMMIDD